MLWMYARESAVVKKVRKEREGVRKREDDHLHLPCVRALFAILFIFFQNNFHISINIITFVIHFTYSFSSCIRFITRIHPRYTLLEFLFNEVD